MLNGLCDGNQWERLKEQLMLTKPFSQDVFDSESAHNTYYGILSRKGIKKYIHIIIITIWESVLVGSYM